MRADYVPERILFGASLALCRGGDARDPFACSFCDHEHILTEAQLDAIEGAFGSALIEAVRLQRAGESLLPSVSLRH